MIRCKNPEEARQAADWFRKHFPGRTITTTHYPHIGRMKYPPYDTALVEAGYDGEIVRPTRESDYPYYVFCPAPIAIVPEPFKEEPGPWICSLGHVWAERTCAY